MRITTFKDLTRIEQTLFGLPFLAAAVLLTFAEIEVSLSFRLLWILPGFMLARISGMAFNQLIDRAIDASNPRTRHRVLPTGGMTEVQARRIAWGALILFLLVCTQINTLCFCFALLAAFLLYSYSYLKRITASCHFVLGSIHFLCPVMASLAISGTVLLSAFFLGCAAACLIVGSDIIYALQDIEFDRKYRLFSLPARLGEEKSLLIARLMHSFCALMLVCVGLSAHLPVFYYLLVGVIGMVFYRFYTKLAKTSLKSVNIGIESLFSACNIVVAFSVFIFIFASVLWDVI